MKNMLKALAGLICAASAWPCSAIAANAIAVGVGQVMVVRSPEEIATLVVGDPAIADVVAEGANAVLVFGKKLGRTDLVLMGKDHALLRRSPIVVGPVAGGDTIVVHRPAGDGISDDAWVCAPFCTRIRDK